jgi:hypothetical protein
MASIPANPATSRARRKRWSFKRESNQVRPPLGEIDDPRRNPVGMQSEPKDINRRPQQPRIGSGD